MFKLSQQQTRLIARTCSLENALQSERPALGPALKSSTSSSGIAAVPQFTRLGIVVCVLNLTKFWTAARMQRTYSVLVETDWDGASVIVLSSTCM